MDGWRELSAFGARLSQFFLDLADSLREITLGAGRLLVIPKGVWHTAKVGEPARLLAITAGLGTEHRPV